MGHFIAKGFFTASQKCVVVATPVAQLSSVEFDNALGHASQKCSVVGNKDDGATETPEQGFDCVDGIDVEMVGGLIQDQQPGIVDQGARQQGAPLAADRHGRELRIGIDPDLGGGLFNQVNAVLIMVHTVRNNRTDTAGQVRRHSLRQIPDPQTLARYNVPGIG